MWPITRSSFAGHRSTWAAMRRASCPPISDWPALPKAWPNGSIRGLRARGGFEVDMTWEDGKIVTLTLKSTLGKRCRIRSASPLTLDGEWFKPSVKSVEAGVFDFNTKAGETYTLVTLPSTRSCQTTRRGRSRSPQHWGEEFRGEKPPERPGARCASHLRLRVRWEEISPGTNSAVVWVWRRLVSH